MACWPRRRGMGWSETSLVLLCMLLVAQQQEGGGVLGNVILRNISDKVVIVSSDASNPTEPGLELEPGDTDATLRVGTYYFNNVKVAQVSLPVDGRLYVIRNSRLSVGLVQVCLAALGAGTVGPVSDCVIISGDF
ncbi:hypothetical protein GOP47_0026620 [Adiantum capillus-veneris]|nr:hypothetical protein GOP47_0026620 [Adiantum capillus-veneris]